MLKELKIELNRLNSSNYSNTIKELEFEDVFRIIKEAKLMGVKTIIFTGEEPLFCEYLPKLIQLVTELRIQSIINTTASRTEKTLAQYQKLITLGLNQINYLLTAEESSIDEIAPFFDRVFEANHAKLGFHYLISKDSCKKLEILVENIQKQFQEKPYFDHIKFMRSILQKTESLEMTKEELITLKQIFSNYKNNTKIRLECSWNVLAIVNTPCMIASETMTIGADGIAYPCDSLTHFKKLGVSGNIKNNTLSEMYDSNYFQNIRASKTANLCIGCVQYSACKSGCLAQKIVANYFEISDKAYVLKRCNERMDPKCTI